MRYSAEHKKQTQARILQEAAASLRMRGPDGVVVADIMASAGLTHGGFYVHFKSKDELIVGAIEESFADQAARVDAMVGGRGPASALMAYVDAYLSQQHRDQRDRSCPIAALAGDGPRLKEPAREAFEQGCAGVTRRIADWLEAMGRPDAGALAGSVVAELVGALVMARAVADPQLSRKILRDSRMALRQRLGVD